MDDTKIILVKELNDEITRFKTNLDSLTTTLAEYKENVGGCFDANKSEFKQFAQDLLEETIKDTDGITTELDNFIINVETIVREFENIDTQLSNSMSESNGTSLGYGPHGGFSGGGNISKNTVNEKM